MSAARNPARKALEEALERGPLTREEAISVMKPHVVPSKALRKREAEWKLRNPSSSHGHRVLMAVRRECTNLISRMLTKGAIERLPDGRIRLKGKDG